MHADWKAYRFLDSAFVNVVNRLRRGELPSESNGQIMLARSLLLTFLTFCAFFGTQVALQNKSGTSCEVSSNCMVVLVHEVTRDPVLALAAGELTDVTAPAQLP